MERDQAEKCFYTKIGIDRGDTMINSSIAVLLNLSISSERIWRKVWLYIYNNDVLSYPWWIIFEYFSKIQLYKNSDFYSWELNCVSFIYAILELLAKSNFTKTVISIPGNLNCVNFIHDFFNLIKLT